ncbi:MAG: hypothetical protein ABMB14_12895 [Myxococcota bacterium]
MDTVGWLVFAAFSPVAHADPGSIVTEPPVVRPASLIPELSEASVVPVAAPSAGSYPVPLLPLSVAPPVRVVLPPDPAPAVSPDATPTRPDVWDCPPCGRG